MQLSIIVAVSENRVIGRNNELPWRLSNDLKRFKKITMGHHIIMGRKTYESINRLLPGRTTVIISRQSNYEVPGAIVAGSLQHAIELATQSTHPENETEELFITGGSQIFCEALPLADKIYLTLVHAEIEGDVYFPEFDQRLWQVDSTERFEKDDKNEFDTSFIVYSRKR